MAQLRDSVVQGSLRVTDTIYSNLIHSTNGIRLLSNTISAFNDSSIYFSTATNTQICRIGANANDGSFGIYAAGTIVLKPSSPTTANADYGLRINTEGLTPIQNNNQNLGTSTYKWNNVYATTFNGNLTGTASDITTTAANATAFIPVGVTSNATTTLLRATQHSIGQYQYTINDATNGGQKPSFKLVGKDYSILFMIGDGNTNRGIYQSSPSDAAKWLLYWGASNAHFNTGVNIDDSTDSNSTSTGALIVSGGVGIAKNLYIGNTIYTENLSLKDASNTANWFTVNKIRNNESAGAVGWTSKNNNKVELITTNTLAFWDGAYEGSTHHSNLKYNKYGKMGNGRIFYGTSTTAAGTTEKIVICEAYEVSTAADANGKFTPQTGDVLITTFSATNSGSTSSLTITIQNAASNPTVVTTANNIKWLNGIIIDNIPAAGKLVAYIPYIFVFTGTYWMVSNINHIHPSLYSQNIGIAQSAIYRYLLLLQTDENKYVPACSTSNQTAQTKNTIYTGEFLISGNYLYYANSSTITANAALPFSYIFTRQEFDLRRSFNTGSTLAAQKEVYLVGIPTANSAKATLRNPDASTANGATHSPHAQTGDGPISQTLPTYDDGYIYIKLGRAFSTTSIILTDDHPVYWFKDGKLRPYPERGLDYGATLPVETGDGVVKDLSEGRIFFQTSPQAYELPTGGAIGHFLIKNSATDRDVIWSANAWTGDGYLSINKSDGGNCYIDLLRNTNADWRILNTGGNLIFQNNWTTAKGSYFNVVTMNYNSGHVTVNRGNLIVNGASSTINLNPTSNRAYFYIGPQTDAQADIVFRSANTNHWSLTCRASGESNQFWLYNYTTSKTIYSCTADGVTQFNNHVFSTGEFRSTTPNAFRLAYGSKSTILRQDGTDFYILLSNSNSTGDNWFTPTAGHPLRINLTTGYSYFSRAYGAVWNDYAEFRRDNIKEKSLQSPGHCVYENGNGTLSLTTERLQLGCEIISDTYGFSIGQDKDNGYNTPIAVSGRVLAYPYETIEEFYSHIGYPVCSGPNGTVSIMTEEEEQKYPSRIIGTISEIPTYEEWGSGKVKVNGRVWIRMR